MQITLSMKKKEKSELDIQNRKIGRGRWKLPRNFSLCHPDENIPAEKDENIFFLIRFSLRKRLTANAGKTSEGSSYTP